MNDYLEELRDDYEDVRQLHYDTLKDRKFVSIEKARAHSLKLDFSNHKPGI